MENIHVIPYHEIMETLSQKEVESLIENNAHPGFKEDYNILQALLKVMKPASIFEVGTNVGTGTDIICKTLPKALVYSLDLDYLNMLKNPSEFPIDANGNDRVGTACTKPYIQLRGDSRTFDYSSYPCQFYFVDAEHTREAVRAETISIISQVSPRVILYHDTDIQEVLEGIIEGVELSKPLDGKSYRIIRVTGTRMTYLTNL